MMAPPCHQPLTKAGEGAMLELGSWCSPSACTLCWVWRLFHPFTHQKLADVCGETFVVVLEVEEPGCAYWLPLRAHCLVYPEQHLVQPLVWD